MTSQKQLLHHVVATSVFKVHNSHRRDMLLFVSSNYFFSFDSRAMHQRYYQIKFVIATYVDYTEIRSRVLMTKLFFPRSTIMATLEVGIPCKTPPVSFINIYAYCEGLLLIMFYSSLSLERSPCIYLQQPEPNQ